MGSIKIWLLYSHPGGHRCLHSTFVGLQASSTENLFTGLKKDVDYPSHLSNSGSVTSPKIHKMSILFSSSKIRKTAPKASIKQNQKNCSQGTRKTTQMYPEFHKTRFLLKVNTFHIKNAIQEPQGFKFRLRIDAKSDMETSPKTN